MRVIGIDPGTAIVGYGILDYEKNKFTPVDYGCIFTDKDTPMEKRLVEIYDGLSALLDKYKPEHLAIEELFYFRNATTVIPVGQARGIILLAAAQRNISIKGYTPPQVKVGVTGYGKAEKKQVQQMVQRLLNLREIPKPDDAADALALAVTHINALHSLAYGLTSTRTLSEKAVKKDKLTADEFRELIGVKR
ncbi:MAG: crossover junction endodeoxyribonuclease RuvC [Fusobacteriaceae bacterium]|jgi:crossover junction endodeoxyribonuclease RuvC|nr:crossover junction endodeoxyribonuclease RuvC [Fusobacteriaceae bacterium]